jgi:nicotinic acid mononucleotide adenylyltransferase
LKEAEELCTLVKVGLQVLQFYKIINSHRGKQRRFCAFPSYPGCFNRVSTERILDSLKSLIGRWLDEGIEKMYISPRLLPHLKKIQTLLNRLHTQAAPQALVVPGSTLPHGDIVVFAGSFNPPTIAHLALLKQAQRFMYEQGTKPFHLYAAFSKRTVDKEGVERPLLRDRILLLQMLLRRRLPHIGILLFNRGLYVEQAEAIRTAFPRVRRIFFLMGFDKLEQILDPRYYEDRDTALEALFRQAELLVAPRGKAHEQEFDELLNRSENRRFARFIRALPFDPLYKDISSTRFRQNSRAYAHDVPQEVRRFMHFNFRQE